MTQMVLLPEVLLAIGAIAVLFADLMPGRDRAAAWTGTGFAVAAAASVYAVPRVGVFFGGTLVYDLAGGIVRYTIAGLTAVFLLWIAGQGFGRQRAREAVSLVLVAALGGMLLTAARDLVVLFLSLELATLPAYVLIGYDRDRARSLEGALKYFLMSMLTSLVMAYGLSFVYGLTGSTAYHSIALQGTGLLGTIAGVLVTVGFLAKLSAAPFHFWAPDAYEGAPVASVAFVSSVSKVAGLYAMVRLIGPMAAQLPSLTWVLLIAAVASMLVGNLGAYPQTDIRRLIAYSGIAHAGYLLLGVAAPTQTWALAAAVFYAIAYAVPSLGIMLVVAEDGSTLDDVAGAVRRRPYAAWSALAFLLSLVGIPPLVGFFGKVYLFSAALSVFGAPIVVFAVLMSVVSAGYYFKVVRSMFSLTEGAETAAPASSPAIVAVLVCAAATIGLGVFGSALLPALLPR